VFFVYNWNKLERSPKPVKKNIFGPNFVLKNGVKYQKLTVTSIEANKAVVEDAELDELNQQLTSQTETLMQIQERLNLEVAAREHGEQKIQEMRREKEQLQQIIQEHKDTAEAFQVWKLFFLAQIFVFLIAFFWKKISVKKCVNNITGVSV